MGKKAHLLRVGKDSAGSHKVHSSRASFSVPIFKNCLGGPPNPHQAFIAPELGFIWQAPFPDLSLDPYLEHHRKFTDSAGSLLGLSSLLGLTRATGASFSVPIFNNFLGEGPQGPDPPSGLRCS